MWIKYNRILSEDGKQWIHPSIVCTEKHLSPTNSTLFLANTTLTSIEGYEQFNVVEVPEANVKTELRNFNIGTKISKSELRRRLTYEENYNFSNYEQFIDAQDGITLDLKVLKKGNMKMLTDQFNVLDVMDLNDESLDTFALIITDCGIITAERLQEILS